MPAKRRFKVQRRIGVVLPGLGDKKAKGPISKRPNPPGFHGPTIKRRSSEFGVRLKEKQKIRFHYGLKEKQIKNMVKKCKKIDSNWLVAFTSMAERRLDNLLFRAGFFPSIRSARQAVSHGNVLVNGKRVDIASYIVSLNSEVTLTEKLLKNTHVIHSLENPTLALPEFLKMENKVVTLLSEPVLSDIPFEFESQYFIEFYGKTK